MHKSVNTLLFFVFFPEAAHTPAYSYLNLAHVYKLISAVTVFENLTENAASRLMPGMTRKTCG